LPEADSSGLATRRAYLVVDKTSSVFNPFHNFINLRYEGVSYVPAAPPGLLRAASADYPAPIREVYLQLPKLDSRIVELARQVTLRAPTAYDKAAAIELFLRTRFGYTLQLPPVSPADPLANFLFERRAGHCEYFASAMTVMLRTLGIPARYINGFLPGEYNEVGEDFIVRASDAHSWVEVYFPEYGWIPFDPTPPAEERARGLLGHLALYWDWFELRWNEWVINYDFLHQVVLAQTLQRASHDWTDRARAHLARLHRDTIERFKSWEARAINAPHAAPLAMGILLLLVLLLCGRALARWLVTSWGLRVSPDSRLAPRLATLYYQQMLRLFARRGLRKQPEHTPREFVASLPAPDLAGPVAQLTDLYQMTRFGAHPADPHEMSRLLARIRQLLRPRR
jgi:transglutaminase-like putative cysteine protease